MVVGPTVDEGVGVTVDARGEGCAVVVDAGEGSVLVMSGVGRGLGSVGLLVTGGG